MTVVGAILDVEIGPPAHGGSCVARHEGQVLFVRHALPGERVRVLVTDQTKHFARADAVEVLTASPYRIQAPCPVATAGGCGGCDWQHAAAHYQRELKAMVVGEQLRRLAGIDRDVVVEPLPGDGFGWRTRVRFAVDPQGRAGFRRARSHHVVPVDHCPIAHPQVEEAGVESRRWPDAAEVAVAVGVASNTRVVSETLRDDRVGQVRQVRDRRDRRHVRHRGDRYLVERAAGREWRVSAGGFWQVHPAASDVLVEAVLDGIHVRPGERALDLYAGVGVFAGALAAAVGPAGAVTAVESATRAVADARVNLADPAGAGGAPVRTVQADVAAMLAGVHAVDEPVDIVVLDPPRSGAGAKVVGDICRLRPRAVAYVACDPAALARDLATFADRGYRLAQLRAFDLFPQTHHVECIAFLEPQDSATAAGER